MKNKMSFALLIIALSFTACEKKYDYVSVDKNITKFVLPKALKNAYSEYWEALSNGDYKKAYMSELPYINFIKPYSWYKVFRAGSKIHYTIEALESKADTDDKDIIFIKTKFTHPRFKPYTINDKWINVNGTWYHSYIASVLPQI